MSKIKVQAGTNNVNKCVFCKYWEGDEEPVYVNNHLYEFDQNARGVCRAQHDAKKRATDRCRNYIDIWNKYLSK